MTDKNFHIPIIRTEFFEDRTHAAINAFLDTEHVYNGARIVAMITDHQIHHEDREIVIPAARLDFLGETEEGLLVSCDPRRFVEPDLRQAFSTLAAAWATDDLAYQSAGAVLPKPPRHQVTDPSWGKLYRHIQARDFALYGREYPVSSLHKFGSKIVGPDAAYDDRGYYMNLLLPPVETSHELVEEAASHRRIEDLARRIYANQMDGQIEELPLAPFDFNKAIKI